MARFILLFMQEWFKWSQTTSIWEQSAMIVAQIASSFGLKNSVMTTKDLFWRQITLIPLKTTKTFAQYSNQLLTTVHNCTKFTSKLLTHAHFHQYAVQLRSCDDSKLVLKLTDGEFSLQSTANSFSVGNGDVVGSETIPPPIFGPGDDSSNLPDSAAEYIYTSTGNQMWMRAMLPQGLYAKFKIQFSVIKTSNQWYQAIFPLIDFLFDLL